MEKIKLKEYNLFFKKTITKKKLLIILLTFLLLIIVVFKIEFYNNKKILLEKIDTFTYEINIPIEELNYIGERNNIMIRNSKYSYKVSKINKDNLFYNNIFYKKIEIVLNKKTKYEKNYIIHATTYEKKTILSNIISKVKGE